MIKQFITLCILGISIQKVCAQNTEKRQLKDFNSIEITGPFSLELTQGDSTSLSLEIENDNSKDILTEVVNDRLVIKTAKTEVADNIKVFLSYKTLNNLEVGGISTVKTKNTLNGDKLTVVCSGASKTVLDVVLKELTSKVSGAATLNISGATETHVSELSGASSLKAAKLSTISSDINSSGASSAKINVNKNLTINAGGVSSVRYFGEPEKKNITAGSTCTIKQSDIAEADIKLNDIDTTRIKIGKKKLIIIDDDDDKDSTRTRSGSVTKHRKKLKHWKGLDLGINGYVGADQNVSLPASSNYMSVDYGVRSLVCNLNLFEKDIHIYKNYINLVTGIGFSFNTYQFRNKTTLNPDSSYTYFYNPPAGISYSKNKLKMSYIQVPLMLEFNTSEARSKNIHLAAGVLAGYKLTSKTKQEYVLDGAEHYVVKKDDYNLNPFKLDLTTRLGYGKFTVFGTYSLTTLFEKDKGPELYPFTVGIRLVSF